MATGKRITLRDIAAAAGVSAPTVSNVLNGNDQRGKVRISDATRTRILRVADELGYTPSLLGQSIRLGRTNQVCVVPLNLYSPWTEALVDAVTGACRTAGKRPLILADGDWSAFLAGQGADGAVIEESVLADGDLDKLRRLAGSGISIVLFHSAAEPDDIDVIRRPILPALHTALRDLTTRHRRIAVLTGDAASTDDERLLEFRDVIAEAGLPLDPDLIRSTGADRYLAFRQAMELLQSEDPPTAIFGTQDLSAIGALWAAQRLGLGVPDDLEIIGIGNTPESLQTDPQLSSVGPPHYFDKVAELLIQRLNGDGPAERLHVYPAEIWHRGTTRAGRPSSKG
ncbi:LacI family DNA-binding transcriptional regulator [Microlunatus soli]|uniref:LacI family transcriptional regulator n=1 Tax=Microlunatus soli TaxID=630515 RepID=A0A1H1P1B0_9ACTN|nr:LacI family DNA-binding transcriptional regulator [Microlunatus soli]SDS04399.1 LacI family transcriptional regulator [Microlunatus soli]